MPQLASGKYDPEIETEVLGWFKTLIDVEVPSGQQKVEKALKDGINLIKLVAKVQEGTPNCPAKAKKMKLKPNTQNAPFKQMENITNFVKFCEAYGLDRQSTFQTVDLFEGRNMAQVLNCIQQLGTECQRNGFTGPTIGPPPTTACAREFTEEQLAEGKKIIGLQAGTNKGASQAGTAKQKHLEEYTMSAEGAGIIGLQAGSNKGASQAGTAKMKEDYQMSAEGANIIGLQAGSNKGASQAGTAKQKHKEEYKMSAEGANIIGLQAGSNKGASQAGSAMQKHTTDYTMDAQSANIIGLQAGSNKGASQAGMAKLKEDQEMVGADVIGLQMGSNKGASQSGMAMGAARHAGDISTGAGVGSDVIGLQAGSNVGASQSGSGSGTRHVIGH